MHLRNTALTILDQIKALLNQLTNDEYNASLDLLSDNSLGKHVRHVLEFFDLLLIGSQSNEINYDKRNHDELIESNLRIAKEKIDDIIEKMTQLREDKRILLKVSYSMKADDPHLVHTSLNRELAYNIEHAVHHMAIMKIAVRTVFPQVNLPASFGVAYSTIRFQKSNA